MHKSYDLIYGDHQSPFESFAKNFLFSQDSFVINVKGSKYNRYDILSEFTAYFQNPNYNKPLSAITLRNRVNAIKNSIEFNDVGISANKFRLKVKDYQKQ